jgi:hypothetical protein
MDEEPIKVIQHRPSWSLHAYLRFNDIPYYTENSLVENSLNMRLPIIVSNNQIFNERNFIENIHDKIKNNWTASDLKVDFIYANHLNTTVVSTLNQFIRLNGDEQSRTVSSLPIGLNLFYKFKYDVQNFFDNRK